MEAGSVQPEGTTDTGGAESQGANDNYGELYPAYNEVPEQLREYVDPILQEVQGNVGKKLEDSANYRKQWEPYGELGVDEVDPDTMGDLIGLLSIMNEADNENPDGFRQWWEAVGQHYGFADQNTNEEDFNTEYDDEGGEDQITGEDLQGLIDGLVQERLSPYMEQMQEQEQEQLVAQANQQIDDQLAELKKDDPNLNEAAVCTFAMKYDGPDAIKKGYEEYKSLINEAQTGLVSEGGDIPEPAETGGRPNTSQKPITTFDEAGKAAREAFHSQLES